MDVLTWFHESRAVRVDLQGWLTQEFPDRELFIGLRLHSRPVHVEILEYGLFELRHIGSKLWNVSHAGGYTKANYNGAD